jgi:Uma2 family endonuclease
MSTIDGLSGGWTYERYYALQDEQRYEVINGELLLVPGPGTFHQSLVGELFVRLREFSLRMQAGTVFVSPLDVVLDDRNVVQPDVLFIRNDRLEIIDPRAIRGTPDLVIEIISPSSRSQDRMLKSTVYARAGVPEYWIVDPPSRSIEVFSLEGAGYVVSSGATGSGSILSRVLPGLAIQVDEVMPLLGKM